MFNSILAFIFRRRLRVQTQRQALIGEIARVARGIPACLTTPHMRELKDLHLDLLCCARPLVEDSDIHGFISAVRKIIVSQLRARERVAAELRDAKNHVKGLEHAFTGQAQRNADLALELARLKQELAQTITDKVYYQNASKKASVVGRSGQKQKGKS